MREGINQMKSLFGSVVGISLLLVTGCASQVETSQPLSLEQQYLSEVNESDPSHFANDQAALSYLKQFCEIRLSGGISKMDTIETIANKYCDTDLAEELGVKTAPTPDASFDEKAFTAKAKKIDPELFKVLDDGSFIEPLALANQICSQSAFELQTMKSNLAGYWNGSFQKFAVQSVCPSKMP